jgi:hypothetical protein
LLQNPSLQQPQAQALPSAQPVQSLPFMHLPSLQQSAALAFAQQAAPGAQHAAPFVLQQAPDVQHAPPLQQAAAFALQAPVHLPPLHMVHLAALAFLHWQSLPLHFPALQQSVLQTLPTQHLAFGAPCLWANAGTAKMAITMMARRMITFFKG